MATTVGISIGGRASGSRVPYPVHVDPRALAAELDREVEGAVCFDDGARALYANDASNYRQVPIGVVLPLHVQDVIAATAVCHRHGAPLLARGAGTGLAGQSVNVAVVLDTSRHLKRIIEVDPNRRLARVEPGVICDHLVRAANAHGLTYGTGPATHLWCTLGGMIGNNACGKYSILHGPVMRGRTSDTIHDLDVLTYDGTRMRVGKTSDEQLEQIIRGGGRRGEIYRRLRALRDRYADLIRQRFPRIPRRVSGYNLDELLPENGFHVARALVGTEGTCVTVLEATLGLEHNPPARVLLLLAYPDVYAAADDVMHVLDHEPTALEGMDDILLNGMRKKRLNVDKLELIPDGGGFLLAEFGGDDLDDAREKAQRLMRSLEQRPNAPRMKLYTSPADMEAVWVIRESGLGATAHVPGMAENHEGWEDAAVHPRDLGNYLRDFRKLLDKYGYAGSLYGHFGQGCVHTRISFDLKTAEGIRTFRAFVDDAADLVVRYNGSFSGEHGEGQSKAELHPKLFGPELVKAFEEFKSIWDPDGKMNPGKVVRPYRITENLHFGADYNPPKLETHFQFPDDNHSWTGAMERCIGVGKCRREEQGTMCPSYMVTHQEKHTTRGRARLLFEMLQGDAIHGGWRDENVKESLDLCLACKGCKGDCPVHVDLATYKSEFLAHYYEGRLRPRQAYLFGLVHVWARLASAAPTLANVVSQTPILRDIAKRLAGVAPQRQLPAFAPQTFRQWFRRRRPGRNPDAPRVILWPDTFNDHFDPGTARAAVEVLEDAGFHVEVPAGDYCCGRPLYEYGMLVTAKRWLREILDGLGAEIDAGVPVVVLEPSCAAVFRDELVNLMPHDERARRLRAQTFTLGEFLQHKAEHYELPQLRGRRALLHGHCHHKAVLELNAEQAVLRRMGIDFEEMDAGCCGMAGAFGFDKDHYQVSIDCGERVLLPRVRDAAAEALIISDGFSCREQIRQGTRREAMHLAEVIRYAAESTEQERGDPPETTLVQRRRRESRRANRRAAAWVGAGATLALACVIAARATMNKRSHT